MTKYNSMMRQARARTASVVWYPMGRVTKRERIVHQKKQQMRKFYAMIKERRLTPGVRMKKDTSRTKLVFIPICHLWI